MTAIVYDRKSNTVLCTPQGRPAGLMAMPSGTTGQISLARLCDVLEKCGEINEFEKLTHLEVRDDGMVRFVVERK